MTDINIEKIEPEVNKVIMAAPAFVEIKAKEEADLVNVYLSQIKEVRTKIAEFFRPEIDAANRLHKNLLAKMKQVDDAPAGAEMKFRRMLSSWLEKERARVADEQRRLDEAARKKAIAEAKKENDSKTVAAIQSGKVAIVSEKTPEPIAKVEGTSLRDLWSAEVRDIKELAKAVASGKVPAEYIMPNMPILNSVMRSTKGQIVIPGVAAKKDVGITKR